MIERIILPVLFFFAALLAAFVFEAEAPASETQEDKVYLFKNKCSRCHTLSRVFRSGSGIREGTIDRTVSRMQSKEPDWISDAEKQVITTLLSGDLDALQKEIAVGSAQGHGNDGGVTQQYKIMERAEFVVKVFHSAWHLNAFFSLGVYMTLSGLSRFVSKRGIASRLIVDFNWRQHLVAGKWYVLMVLAGFMGGMTILWLEAFHVGSLWHFISGIAITVLYAAAGVMGLAMEKGSENFSTAHAFCALSATALFLFNIVSGLMKISQ